MPRPENESARWLATGARFKPANASTALKDDRTPASAQVDDDLLQFNAALAQLGAQPDELDARPFGNGSLFRDGTPERHREVEEMFAPANAAFAELREIQLKKPWVKISIYAMAGGAEGLRAKIEATRKQREAVTSASSPEGNNSQPPPVAQRSGAKPLAKKPPVIDADEIRRALMLVRQEGAVFEIRALNAQLKGDRFNGTLFGYFSSVDRCIEELGRIHAATGIYITLNPVNRALLARANNRLKFARKDDRATNDTDIESRRWLLIDVDAVRPAGVSATDEEKEAAFAKGGLILAFLRERGWGEPGVVADSGNGMHLLYRVDLPCDDGKLIERVLYSLAQRFDGDGAKLDRAVHNASRIVRLHGTLAAKGDHIDERPHRLSKQLSTSAEKITPELIDALVKELTPRPKIELPSRKKASQQAQTNEKPSRELIREMLAAIPGRPGHADWTNYIAAVADALPDSEAIAVLKERWPEEKEGEYEIALKHRKKEIHIGTLIHAAQQHGYKFPKKVTVTSEPEREELPPPPPPYVQPPLDLLPAVLQDYVCAAAESLNVDVGFVLFPYLAAIGTAIGNSRSVLLKRGYVQPPIVWSSIIGASGTARSPAIELATLPLRIRERNLERQNREALEIYEDELAEWEGASKKLRGSKPKEPICSTCWIDDITIETVSLRLNENPRGVCLVKDELSHWFESFDLYHNRGSKADLSRWLSIHNGTLLALDRSKEKRSFRIWNPRLCIASAVQTKILRRLLKPDYFDRGLPARFLFAAPPTSQRKWTEKSVHEKLEAAMLSLFDDLWELHPQIDDDKNRLPILLSLDKEAKEIFVDFYNECGEATIQSAENEAAQWAKLSNYAARLALEGQLAADPRAEIITGPIMLAACNLSRWEGNEARRIYAMLVETPEQHEERRLIDFIRSRGDEVSVRDVMQNYWPLKNKRELVHLKLNALERRFGVWKESRPSGAGRPTRVFRLFPAPRSTQSPSSPSIVHNSVDVDTSIERGFNSLSL